MYTYVAQFAKRLEGILLRANLLKKLFKIDKNNQTKNYPQLQCQGNVAISICNS